MTKNHNQLLDNLIDAYLNHSSALNPKNSTRLCNLSQADTPLCIYPIMLMAGLSRRMGDSDKLLLPFKDSTVGESALQALADQLTLCQENVPNHRFGRLRQLVIEPIRVVVSNPQTQLLVEQGNHLCINNATPHLGQGCSLALGAQDVVDHARLHRRSLSEVALLISLADQPILPSELVYDLIYLAQRLPVHRPYILTPCLLTEGDADSINPQPQPFHPTLFVGNASSLCKLTGDVGGRTLWDKTDHYQLIYESNYPAFDIDTPKDYQSATRFYKHQKDLVIQVKRLVCSKA